MREVSYFYKILYEEEWSGEPRINELNWEPIVLLKKLRFNMVCLS